MVSRNGICSPKVQIRVLLPPNQWKPWQGTEVGEELRKHFRSGKKTDRQKNQGVRGVGFEQDAWAPPCCCHCCMRFRRVEMTRRFISFKPKRKTIEFHEFLLCPFISFLCNAEEKKSFLYPVTSLPLKGWRVAVLQESVSFPNPLSWWHVTLIHFNSTITNEQT